ncbi:MAG: LysR substrate-binding domain-containing protein [Burkholderiaceae bacterium]
MLDPVSRATTNPVTDCGSGENDSGLESPGKIRTPEYPHFVIRRRLPPFAALRAFEAAARYGNFKKAAEDLCLSASAISHQVRSLEEFLGLKLFNRDSGKPVLTTSGMAYLESINDVFDRLDAATNRLAVRGDRRELVINVSPSLLSCWLLARLPTYKASNPDVDIKFLGSYQPLEFGAGDIDMAIRYGSGEWQGVRSVFLMHDELFLVTSPEMAKRLPPLDRIEELKEFTFIYCAQHLDEWQQWAGMASFPIDKIKSRLEFESRSLVLEAVAGGLGIAIGRMPSALTFLESGKICAPYPLRLRTQAAYYLVYPEHHEQYANVKSFQAWLLDESQVFDGLIT